MDSFIRSNVGPPIAYEVPGRETFRECVISVFSAPGATDVELVAMKLSGQ